MAMNLDLEKFSLHTVGKRVHFKRKLASVGHFSLIFAPFEFANLQSATPGKSKIKKVQSS